MSEARHLLSRRFNATIAAGICVKRVANAGGQITVGQATDGGLEADEPIDGIAERGGTSGRASDVTRLGPAKAISGAAINPLTERLLTCDSDGKLIPATSGDQVVAIFEGKVDPGAADKLIDVFVVAGQGLVKPVGPLSTGTATATAAAAVAYVDVALGANFASKKVFAALVTPGDATATHLEAVEDRTGGTYRLHLNAAPTADVDIDYVVFN